MQLRGNQLLYAPSDLGNFIACEHLSQIELAAALGESTRPYFSNAYVDLIARKGEEHERNFLEALRADMLAGFTPISQRLGGPPPRARASASFLWNTMAIAPPQTRR